MTLTLAFTGFQWIFPRGVHDMATLTVKSLECTGSTFSFESASSGLADKFLNDGETFIYIKNGDGSTKSVIITSELSPLPKGVALSHTTIELAGTAEKIAGPFNPAIWNDSSGYVNLTWATHTAMTIAVFSFNT